LGCDEFQSDKGFDHEWARIHTNEEKSIRWGFVFIRVNSWSKSNLVILLKTEH